MSKSSSAYVTCTMDGKAYTWHFTGVVSIGHSLALDLDNEAVQGEDIVNGARNLSDQVTLQVIETDAEHSPGRSSSVLAAMRSLKKNRTLCRVVTSMAAYDRMLLTEISATQDGENQDGWSGTLTFTEYIPAADAAVAGAKVNDNSSVRKNTGSAGAQKLIDTVFRQLLQRSGIQ